MHDIGGEGIIAKKNQLDEDKLLSVIQFTSSRKKASVVVKTDYGVRVYTKGAPDMLFPCIKDVLNSGEVLIEGIDQTANVPADLIFEGQETS
jgi:P-type Ca2+ transporter type 2C